MTDVFKMLTKELKESGKTGNDLFEDFITKINTMKNTATDYIKKLNW